MCLTGVGAPRIVSTSPELTELLFQLDKGGDVVATASFSEYPEAAKKLSTIGPLFAPSIERTLALAPDWVLLDATNPVPAFERALEATPARRLRLEIPSVEALFREAARFLSAVYGETSSPALDRARRCVASFAGRRLPSRFLVLVWMDPPILAGHGTFLSDLLVRLGGQNALPASWGTPYPQVSVEWLIGHEVDTIYALADTAENESAARAAVRRWWPKRTPRVIPLANARFARASLTPLRHLSDLGVETGEECREPIQ